MRELTLLQLKVLWLISKKKYHGYELMERLKVSQGTIYPLLRSLEKNRLIRSLKKDLKKEYQITKKGGNLLKKSCEEFCEIYEDIFREYVCKKCGVKK